MTNLERALPIMASTHRLLANYLLNRKRGTATVRKMIREDISVLMTSAPAWAATYRPPGAFNFS